MLLLHGWWVEVEAWDVELLLGLDLVENVESAEGLAVEAGVDLAAGPLQEELLKSLVAEVLDHRLTVARPSLLMSASHLHLGGRSGDSGSVFTAIATATEFSVLTANAVKGCQSRHESRQWSGRLGGSALSAV